MLEPLGIIKGKPFAPDARQTKILNEGAALGELMTRNLQINKRHTELLAGYALVQQYRFYHTPDNGYKSGT